MKKIQFWSLLAGLLFGSMSFIACSSSDDSTDDYNGGGGGNLPPTPVVDPTLTQAYLCGFARMSNGNPATYITVTTGSATTTTDQNGFFEFKRIKIVDGRVVVKFSADYIQDVVRSFEYKQGEVWDVVLLENYQASSSLPSKSESYASTTDKQISVTNTAKDFKVDLQKDGYKDAATGEAYSGTVNASVTYLNPDDEENFADQMPGGDLAAKDQNGEPVQLVSYGMTCVNLEGGGKKLQLADGKPAKAHFPIPETLKDDPRVKAHENIPLWSFNESTGLWEYEGEATYDAEAGDYVGSVKHFSWANLDWPESRATVKGKVTDGEGNILVSQRVHVGQRVVYTDANGNYSCYVPANTAFDITVRSSDYGNYTADGSSMVTEHVSWIAAQTEKVVNLSLPSLCKITGKIKNNGTGGNEATVWIEYTYNGTTKTSRRARSASDGSFTILTPSYVKGKATLKFTSADGTTIQKTIELTGEDLPVGTIEIHSNATTESGKVTVKVKSTGKTFTFDVPNVDLYSFEGVRILKDKLTCGIMSRSSQMNHGWIHGDINITEFSPSKEDYTNVSFEYGGEIMNPEATDKAEGYMVNINGAKDGITAKVTIKNGKATFTINGDVFFSYHSFNEENSDDGIDPEGETPNATISGSFTIDIFYQAETVAQTTSSDSRIPSWAPKLDGKDVQSAFFITNSAKLGKAAAYSYYSDDRISDFTTLLNKVKALGYTLYEYRDDSDFYWETWYTYYSGDKVVKIFTDTYGLKERSFFFEHAGNIDVYVFDGTIFDVSEFYNSWNGPFVKGDKKK